MTTTVASPMEVTGKIGGIELKPGSPKLLTHVGVTYNVSTPEEELKKAKAAIRAGTDIIADVSLGKQAKATLKLLCENLKVPVTSLPGYILATQHGQYELDVNISKNEILEVTEEVLSYGISGFTIHSAFKRKHLEEIENSNRIFKFTSRMGNYIRKYMQDTNKENPFYECFPEVVQLAKKYGATISIGTALRSPSVANEGGFDELFKSEIREAAELVKLCKDNGVEVMLEGVGHITIDKIPEWYQFSKEVCHNVPLRALPMVSDRGMGHDNVTGAIAATFLARAGVEVICTMTRAEHISQPTLGDIRESVVCFRIALASAFPDMEKEFLVGKAREEGGCHLPAVIKNVIDPQGAYQAFVQRAGLGNVDFEKASDALEECTMCGLSCPIKKEKNKSAAV